MRVEDQLAPSCCMPSPPPITHAHDQAWRGGRGGRHTHTHTHTHSPSTCTTEWKLVLLKLDLSSCRLSRMLPRPSPSIVMLHQTALQGSRRKVGLPVTCTSAGHERTHRHAGTTAANTSDRCWCRSACNYWVLGSHGLGQAWPLCCWHALPAAPQGPLACGPSRSAPAAMAGGFG